MATAMKMSSEPTVDGGNQSIVGLSDEDLFSGFLRERKDDFFSELVRRHQNAAYRLASCICRNDALAEEAVQDAFLQLTRPECRFTPTGPNSFTVWFTRVAANMAKMLVRREKRLSKYVREKQKSESADMETREKNGQTEISPPLHQAEDKLLLQEVLKGLDADLRVPILLHVVEGLSLTDVGRTLDVSPQLIKHRVDKGLELLRKRLVQRGATYATTIPVLLREGLLQWQAPATLQNVLVQLPAQAAMPGIGAGESIRGGAMSFLWKIAGVGILAATIGGFYALRSLTPTNNTTEMSVAPTANQDLPASLWSFDFNQGKPSELRFLQGNWEYRPAGGVNDSGSLWAVQAEHNSLPATFALPENCPPNVWVSFDLRFLQPQNINHQRGLGWGWDPEPVGGPLKLGGNSNGLLLAAEDGFYDGRLRRFEIQYFLEEGIILVSVDGRAVSLNPFNTETIAQIPAWTPTFTCLNAVLDNLTVRTLTPKEKVKTKALLAQILNFEIETYGFYYGFDVVHEKFHLGNYRLAYVGEPPKYLGGRPEKSENAADKNNFAYGFKASRKSPTWLYCPTLHPEGAHLVRFDYYPENAAAGELGNLSCHFIAVQPDKLDGLTPSQFNQLDGTPMQLTPMAEAGSAVSLKPGTWHEMEFFMTKDRVLCLVNGRPWFIGKDPRALAQFGSIVLVISGHSRVDNLRGRLGHPNDQERLKSLWPQPVLGDEKAKK
jgi:RNA polymerase sigma-70 factor (ECF subfamily)